MTDYVELLPWQVSQWDQFTTMVQGGRLPHALLLRGQPGVGKHVFAERITKALLCRREPAVERPCGECRTCRLLAAGTHPDLMTISPLEDKKTIGIDQIRDVIAWMGLTPQFGGYKVCVLNPAESMTTAAANSLLKTLEEPPGQAAFLLISHLSTLLPPTIRSRCQFLNFSTPASPVAQEWLRHRLPSGHDPELYLNLANGAPLAALQLVHDGDLEDRATLFEDLANLARGKGEPVSIAMRWKGLGIGRVLNWVVSFTQDLIRIRSVDGSLKLANRDLEEPMQHLREGLDLTSLFYVLDRCTEARHTVEGRANLNEQLLLEGIAICWASMGRTL